MSLQFLLLLLLVAAPLISAIQHVAHDAVATTVVVTEAPTVPSTAPQFVTESLFTSAILNSTNVYRAAHNASSLSWNTTLEDYANAYLNSTCAFQHSGGPYGENLAIGCSNATSCVEAWGNEEKDYSYKHPGFSEQTGHFTQLVWKNTTDVGCGARLCGESGWYLVCEYFPRGNVVGDFKEEVEASVSEAAVLRAGAGVIVAMLIFVWALA